MIFRRPSVRYLLTDHRAPELLDDVSIDIMREHIFALDAEIRTALRGTAGTYGLGLVALALVVSINKDISADFALPALPILVGIAAAYNFLVAADIAVLAEVRDRLASRLTANRGTPVLLFRLASDVRRNSPGTLALNSSLILMFVGLSAAAVAHAVQIKTQSQIFHVVSYPTVVIGSLILIWAAVATTFLEVESSRRAINGVLDEIFGVEQKPESAQ